MSRNVSKMNPADNDDGSGWLQVSDGAELPFD